MRLVVGSHFTQAIRTVAFHKNDVSLPFFTAKMVIFPLESTHFFDLQIEKLTYLLVKLLATI